MRLFKTLRLLKQNFSKQDPLIKVYIDREKLLHNLNSFQKEYPTVKFAPVLKSNAYGHGLLPIAQILEGKNIAFLVVDSLYEARLLRSNGIKTKILVIGYTRTEEIKKNRLKNVSFTLTGLTQFLKLKKTLHKTQYFHLKVDTGMHRQGFLIEEVKTEIKHLSENKKIVIEGVCSHFADADNLNQSFCLKQVESWNQIIAFLKEKIPNIKYFHLAATGGTFYLKKAHTNVARLGLGLYGMDPSKIRKMNLKPVLEVRSIISGLKKVKKGNFIGYSLTFEAKKELLSAVVPAGYFEGIDRRLSNRGFFKIKNTFCPILGRVSMNMTTIDVTKMKNVSIEDEVLLISSCSSDKNSILNIAQTCETNPYEILVHLPQHLRRELI